MVARGAAWAWHGVGVEGRGRGRGVGVGGAWAHPLRDRPERTEARAACAASTATPTRGALRWGSIDMNNTMLHELAHGYHDHALGPPRASPPPLHESFM